MALENKLGLESSGELAREEERISKKKAVELFERSMLDTLEPGKFSSLAAIHKQFFGELYAFAEEIRGVNTAFRFAPVMYLRPTLEHIENRYT